MTDTKAGNGTEVVNMGVSMAPGHPGERHGAPGGPPSGNPPTSAWTSCWVIIFRPWRRLRRFPSCIVQAGR